VNSGSIAYGLSATTTKSIHDPGISTRGNLSCNEFTCAMTMPSRKAVASAITGDSSVFAPVYKLPSASAESAAMSAMSGVRSTK
jgi:hypothetical protein